MELKGEATDLSSPFSDLMKLKVWKRYAGAIYGAMGVTIQGPNSLGSFLEEVERKVEQNLVRRQVLLNHSMRTHLDTLEADALKELERRMVKQYNSVLIDADLDGTFMSAGDSKAWEKLARREKTIQSFEEGASALPAMSGVLEEMRKLTQHSKQDNQQTDTVGKRSRSPSTSPSRSDGVLRSKTVSFTGVKPEATEDGKKRVKKRQRTRIAPDGSVKHPDSGMIFKEGNNMVLVCADGSKVGLPVKRVRQLLPPELRARACLETAINNQTGIARMKWCPHKQKEGHESMGDEAHAGIPSFIAKMFKREAQPLQ
jgi:hypothetical protein